MRDCPRPCDVTRAAKRKLDYFAKKRAGTPALASLLVHLCEQVDEELAADDDGAAAETGAGAASVTLLEDSAAVESRLYDAMLVAATTRGESSAGPSTESVDEVSFVPGEYLVAPLPERDAHCQASRMTRASWRNCCAAMYTAVASRGRALTRERHVR